MKTIVITGSTRGIGFGLADAFLSLGCNVTISGRSGERVEKALKDLAAKYPPERVFGQACDVTQFDQVQALWEASQKRFGRVDIWINNAGLANNSMAFWKVPPEQARQVLETNLLGACYGAKVALEGMLAQGYGSIYNMEGMGSDGHKHAGLNLYGTSKYGLRCLTDSLALEVKDTPVIVGALRPGMVATDMLTEEYKDRPEEWERLKRIFNILAERVETVAPWLARQILQNRNNGVRIQYTTRIKMIGKFLVAPFRKRDLFA